MKHRSSGQLVKYLNLFPNEPKLASDVSDNAPQNHHISLIVTVNQGSYWLTFLFGQSGITHQFLKWANVLLRVDEA